MAILFATQLDDGHNKLPQTYENKPLDYFSRARTELYQVLPDYAEQVLEIGCGSGATLAWMKAQGLAGHTTGIELAPQMAEQAGQNVDSLIIGDAEALLDDIACDPVFDLVLCLDVLEHFVDPWRMIEKISRALKQGGLVVASIPNVRHFSVLGPLLFKGRWDYEEAGILDHTHLRFFTKASAASLLQTNDLDVIAVVPNIQHGSKSYWAKKLSFGLLADFCTVQYLVCAKKR